MGPHTRSTRHNAATIERLRALPLFATCTWRELAMIATRMTDLDTPTGGYLTREADIGREFFVLLSGTADVISGGRRIATLERGDFVGELSLLDGGPRSASVVATSHVTTLVSDRGEFAGILALAPNFARRLLDGVAGRLRTSVASGAAEATARGSVELHPDRHLAGELRLDTSA